MKWLRNILDALNGVPANKKHQDKVYRPSRAEIKGKCTVEISHKGFNNQSVVFRNAEVNESFDFVGGNVFVDGKKIAVNIDQTLPTHINVYAQNVGYTYTECGDIHVEGATETGDLITGKGDIEVTGNVNGKVQTGQGDVTVNGNVSGGVKTGQGDINVKQVTGGMVIDNRG